MATHDITDERRDELDAMLDEYTNEELERYEDPDGDYFDNVLACCAGDAWTYNNAADRIQRWYGNPDVTSADIDDLYEQIMDAATPHQGHIYRAQHDSLDTIELVGWHVGEVEVYIPAELISDDAGEVMDLIERHDLRHDDNNVITYVNSDVVLQLILTRDALTEIINEKNSD